MAVYNHGPKSFLAGEALEQYRAVKYVSGEVLYADADEAGVGVTMDVVVSGESVNVALFNSGGTVKLTAGEAITDGADLYNLADGKVGDTDPGSGTVRFIALEAATAANEIIEVLPVVFN